MASHLTISPEDAARFVAGLAGPSIRSCVCTVVKGRLHVAVTFDSGIALIGSLAATVSLRATLESPTLAGIDIHMEKAPGITALVRPFLKSILERILPPALRGVVDIQTNTRAVVHLDKLQIGAWLLNELLTVESRVVPEGQNAAEIGFTLREGAALAAMAVKPG